MHLSKILVMLMFILTWVIFKDLGKLEEAIQAYKKALQLKPDYAIVYNNIGKVFQEQGYLDAAIAAYKKSISLNSKYADPHILEMFFKNNVSLMMQLLHTRKHYLSTLTMLYNNMYVSLRDQGEVEDSQKRINIQIH